MWVLHGLDGLTIEVVRAALASPNGSVRAAAIHVGESLLKSEDKADAIEALENMGGDPSPKVQLQLALTFGQVHDKTADDLMASLLDKNPNNTFLPDAIISGLAGRELELLQRLLLKPSWNKSRQSARIIPVQTRRVRHVGTPGRQHRSAASINNGSRRRLSICVAGRNDQPRADAFA